MWFVSGEIRGDGDSHRPQSPECPLIDLGILTASFYKHCHWWWPSDIRSMRVGCSCGSEAPLVLVSPDLEMLDSDLGCYLYSRHLPRNLIDVHWINDLWWNLLQGLLACVDWSLHCWLSRESPISFKETYPYDIYHEGDITLVTLGSVLALFSP
jgi:hypothetical protein